MQISTVMPRINTRTVRNPTAEEIARLAYHLYLEQGSQQGYELEDWLRAEQLLFQQLNEPDAPLSSPVAEAEEDPSIHIQEIEGSKQDFAPDHRGLSHWEDIRRSNIPYRPPSRYSPPSPRDYAYFWSPSHVSIQETHSCPGTRVTTDDAELLPAAPTSA